jgi:hypothetical protein
VGAIQGQASLDAKAAAGGSTSRESSVNKGDSFVHADEPVAGRPRFLRSGPVVDDRYVEVVEVVTQQYVHVGVGCVLDGVGQRLLDHPVGAEINDRRKGTTVALHPHHRMEPGVAGGTYELVELRQGWLRTQWRRGIALPEHAQQGAQLGQRGAGGSLDETERLQGSFAARRQSRAGGAR